MTVLERTSENVGGADITEQALRQLETPKDWCRQGHHLD